MGLRARLNPAKTLLFIYRVLFIQMPCEQFNQNKFATAQLLPYFCAVSVPDVHSRD